MLSSFLPASQLCVIQQNQDGFHSLLAPGWVSTSPGSTGCVPRVYAEQVGAVCLPWGAGTLGGQAAFQPPGNRGTSFPGRRLAGGRGAARPGDKRGGFPVPGYRSPPRGSARARLFRAAPLRAGRRRGGEEGGAGGEGAVRASWRGRAAGGRLSRRGQVLRTSSGLPGAEARPCP